MVYLWSATLHCVYWWSYLYMICMVKLDCMVQLDLRRSAILVTLAREGGAGGQQSSRACSRQESMAAAEVMQLVTHSQLDIRESQRGSNGRGGCSSLETSLLATSLTPWLNQASKAWERLAAEAEEAEERQQMLQEMHSCRFPKRGILATNKW